MKFNYHIPTKILFGPGKLKALAREKLPGKKALIVISSGNSMKKNGYLEKVVDLLKANNTESVIFDKILPNPIKKHVMEGAQLAKTENCDFVIGLGGGSSIDSAKSIALMVRNDGDYWDYISGGTGKGKKAVNGVLPIVAITTTAGTGTEADPWTVITHEERNEKIGFGMIPQTFPILSIVDPELMLTVPKMLTAYQGFDAFFHAAEGYIADIATPISDSYAIKSIELLAKYLPIAVKDGSNLEARTNVALANTLSGFVESTSTCTSEHSLEHAMSAFYPKLPHGAGLIMLSKAYFTIFSPVVPERYRQMAQAMGKTTEGFSKEDETELFIKALVELQEKCGVANLKMSDYGIKEEDLPRFAQNAFETMGALFERDRKQLTMEDVIGIYRDSFL
ncbi:iron-containing alcohol dehydrogenase [bacterium]|nr:iron-containing alcohol dehydrogenase [bacterium]